MDRRSARNYDFITMLDNNTSIPFERIFEFAPSGILLLDPDGKIVNYNPAEQHLSGYNSSSLIGADAGDLVAEKDRERFCKSLDLALQNTEAEVEVNILHRDGSSIPVWRKIVSYIENNVCLGYIIHSFDITVKRGLIEQLKHQADTDQLTGLFNRRAFYKRAEFMMRYAKRYDGELALLFIDLDKFKSTNDTYGHETGDSIIIEMSDRIRKSIRDTDIAARIGGDEFVVLLSGDRIDTKAYADRLYRSLIQPIQFEDVSINSIGASIGIAVYPEDGKILDEILANADSAMYEAKKSESRRIAYWHPGADS